MSHVIWLLMFQALEKADEAKNTAERSVALIATTTNTVDDIIQQIGQYYNKLIMTEMQQMKALYHLGF